MPLFPYTRAGRQPPAPRRHTPLPWIALIALILGAIALAFAWLAGWIGRERLTAQRFTDTIEATGAAHPGFRRAHSKGVCVSGWFEPSAQAPSLSRARVFAQPRVPVLGRLPEAEMPLPVTSLEPAAWRALRAAWYEIGAQAAHLVSDRF